MEAFGGHDTRGNCFFGRFQVSRPFHLGILLLSRSNGILDLILFRYIEDCITKDEATKILREQVEHRKGREAEMIKNGFPAYTTQVGWLGYPDEKIRTLSKHFIERGFTAFKMKVGSDLEDDKRRLRFVANSSSKSDLQK